MSYSLVFWRQLPARGEAPDSIYRQLLEGEQVEGLITLPIESFLAAVTAEFPGVQRGPNGAHESLVWDGGPAGMFELSWSRQHVLVDCRGMAGTDMNRIMDVAAAFDCPLYDPQASERFALGGL